ncbi:neutral protease MCYG [Acrasis kona]|uniref:Neutral protease MCYG n=1 Tax=Acrasis kona TaxID=1008807 RepID=A0AAW2ZRX3_9EUKA
MNTKALILFALFASCILAKDFERAVPIDGTYNKTGPFILDEPNNRAFILFRSGYHILDVVGRKLFTTVAVPEYSAAFYDHLRGAIHFITLSGRVVGYDAFTQAVVHNTTLPSVYRDYVTSVIYDAESRLLAAENFAFPIDEPNKVENINYKVGSFYETVYDRQSRVGYSINVVGENKYKMIKFDFSTGYIRVESKNYVPSFKSSPTLQFDRKHRQLYFSADNSNQKYSDTTYFQYELETDKVVQFTGPYNPFGGLIDEVSGEYFTFASAMTFVFDKNLKSRKLPLKGRYYGLGFIHYINEVRYGFASTGEDFVVLN